jgi:catechol 2,3-dioxygenase
MTEGTALSSPDHAVNMPAHVGHAHLVVADLLTTSDWYRKVMGLSVLERGTSGHTLGVDGRPLLMLTTDGNAIRRPRAARPACSTTPSSCRAAGSFRAGLPMPPTAAPG